MTAVGKAQYPHRLWGTPKGLLPASWSQLLTSIWLRG